MPGMAHAVEHLLFIGTKKVSFAVYSYILPETIASNKTMLTHLAYAVPQGERVQPIPDRPLCICRFWQSTGLQDVEKEIYASGRT